MILIVGFGNPLRGDDGLGFHVAHHLKMNNQDKDVQVNACHQLTPELAEPISRADLVIFIDASADATPGELSCRLLEPVSSAPGTFSHHLDPASLLSLARALYASCPKSYVISVGGAVFGYQTGCSPLVQETLPNLMERVWKLIEQARRESLAEESLVQKSLAEAGGGHA